MHTLDNLPTIMKIRTWQKLDFIILMVRSTSVYRTIGTSSSQSFMRTVFTKAGTFCGPLLAGHSLHLASHTGIHFATSDYWLSAEPFHVYSLTIPQYTHFPIQLVLYSPINSCNCKYIAPKSNTVVKKNCVTDPMPLQYIYANTKLHINRICYCTYT